MLEVRKSITLSGTISVGGTAEDGTNMVPVVYMSASIEDNSSSSVTKSIQNKELYLVNKTAVKQDISEFEDIVDSMIK